MSQQSVSLPPISSCHLAILDLILHLVVGSLTLSTTPLTGLSFPESNGVLLPSRLSDLKIEVFITIT